jgi:hypothetical protein
MVNKMMINATKNWKKLLNLEDEMLLNEILMRAASHRGAYRNSDDVKIAQLWCSMIESKKQMNQIDERLRRIEHMLSGLIQRNREEEDKLLKTLRNF